MSELPIFEVLEALKHSLVERNEVVLQAPPGAGKTTQVPLALLQEPWLGNQKILMLEPRRIATKNAALRMASLLGETPGQTVGYRMRLDTKVGKQTRIEVITEGILTRMLQSDPSLEGVGLVIFDEFHERNLDSDLALALCLNGRQLFREDNPLKLLVMSATLDGERIASLMNYPARGDAPIITSEGKQFPIDVHYGAAAQPRDRIVDRMVATLNKVSQTHSNSSILAFLPGQGEINQTAKALNTDSKTRVCPLYGNLTIEAQQEAISPSPPGTRKIVLATNIAETSLTIDGVDVVVDSGLVREPVFDPATGLTRLQTSKISRASAIQRAGRAGRLQPGHCYRLWSESQQGQMQEHIQPEILNADLSGLALQLLSWGISDPEELAWLDPPPVGPWQQAMDLLVQLGAAQINQRDHSIALTQHGKLMAGLAMAPRLAHLLITSATLGAERTGALLAALFSDRDPFFKSGNPDLLYRLDILEGKQPCPDRQRGWLFRTRQLAEQYLQQLSVSSSAPLELKSEEVTACLVASAYPDRIGRQRHSGGYQLANGRSASFEDKTPLAKHRWLAVAEVSGVTRSKGDVIRTAVPLNESLFESLLEPLVSEQEVVEWDKKQNKFVAEHQHRIGQLILSRQTIKEISPEAKTDLLLDLVARDWPGILNWSESCEQLRTRMQIAHTHAPNDWPDVSMSHLKATLHEWLGPYLGPVNKLADFKKLDLTEIFSNQLGWDKKQQLDVLLPERIEVPSGSSIKVDYQQSPPVLAVKLQEMFGAEETPTVLNGALPLVVHLLSPAGRPLQVTQDLAGFWRSSYEAVKKDMKGRYPKHPWPDDPLTSLPTAKTKRHLS